jgi:predicted glycosyltransferase
VTAPRVLIAVQHLRGIGHLARMAAIARSLAEDGFRVEIVSGGMPVTGLDIGGARLTQLPPVRSPDDQFTRLVDETGNPATPALHEARARLLCSRLTATRPDALVIEMFPFGRGQIAGELIALIEAARALRPRPLVLSSVRDILPAKRDAARYQEMADQVLRWFDGVLVHGDQDAIPFEASFPETARIAGRLHYTGYVLANPPPPVVPSHEVVVSAGGGAFGHAFLTAALAARAEPNMAPADRIALDQSAPPGITVEPGHRDLVRLIAGARLSISQCGYNTALEVLAAGVPAVFVPYRTGRQTEQDMRALAFERLGACARVDPNDGSPTAIARAANRAIAESGPPARLDLTGTTMTTQIIREYILAHSRETATHE